MNFEFESRVSSTVERYGMDLSRPLAMVSGGPDSVAMLRAVVALGGRPVVLHADHGLRGEESRADAEFVRRLCEDLGLECEVSTLDLAEGPALQERARGERYEVASDLSRSIGATAIATGHTADDVAETVLMNLARGAGLRGLAGIPPVRAEIARPLIEVGRAEILQYLKGLAQSYRTDPTNATAKYSRNRVRNEVLPVLESLYPGAGGNISRAAGLLRQDLEALESLAAESLRARGDELLLPSESELAPALRRHALRIAYARLAPSEPPLDSGHVESVLGLQGGGTRTVDLPAGVVAAVRYSGEISLYERRESPRSETRTLLAGETEFAGWVFEAREQDAPESLPEDAARADVCYLDSGLGPYRLRLAREGDEVRPLGLGGSKKVLRAMMDRKVPKDLRRRTPVVVDESGSVAWVAGGEVGEEFAVTERSRRVFRLQVWESGEKR
ncbi:MAG: tRNA lysidine(34) synthetase TilS [Rubrobacter sp.]|nr:tRNA lysidine(34) synthetase TilS [Rubrobacter sp.]